MEYGDFEITVLAGADGFEARVRGFDRRQFTIAGSDRPHLLRNRQNMGKPDITQRRLVVGSNAARLRLA